MGLGKTLQVIQLSLKDRRSTHLYSHYRHFSLLAYIKENATGHQDPHLMSASVCAIILAWSECY